MIGRYPICVALWVIELCLQEESGVEDSDTLDLYQQSLGEMLLALAGECLSCQPLLSLCCVFLIKCEREVFHHLIKVIRGGVESQMSWDDARTACVVQSLTSGSHSLQLSSFLSVIKYWKKWEGLSEGLSDCLGIKRALLDWTGCFICL